ncbi:saccharopine dehydrogenase family protein [Kordiimonas pumila]|uniref:Saccharopine dehydrogenase family protein n=1 Tax=Kordiimonas pumila TaxID=2161677 RepID=A0ABV7DA70_9PROT|nr:saccharopine dehydrogenase family protein [Kordiimonas pumila]
MTHKTSIHWVGAGLASGPGIVSIAKSYGNLTVWDMTSDRAEMLKKQAGQDADMQVKLLDLGDDASVAGFKAAIAKGDIVVSMLPAALHIQMAEIALETGAHLVTSSYVSPEMQALDNRAKEAGIALVNEVGLDPGIDHLFTHLLVDAAQKASVLGCGNAIDFVSYCGGIPAVKNDFTYKFAWTPYGVLTALKNQARFIENGAEKTVTKAWEDVSELAIHGETFEVYANRNSVPYVKEYGLDGETNLQKFVRGTIRLEGWKTAWKDIFNEVDTADTSALKELSAKLWKDYAYGEKEEDRVVLYVALTAQKSDGSVWEGSLTLDEKGSGWKTAMAATVSLTVAEAVLAVAGGDMAAGVHAAITDVAKCRKWLNGLIGNGLSIKAENVSL